MELGAGVVEILPGAAIDAGPAGPGPHRHGYLKSSSCSAVAGIAGAALAALREENRELALELDKAGFSEANLAAAWRETTNREIAGELQPSIPEVTVVRKKTEENTSDQNGREDAQ